MRILTQDEGTATLPVAGVGVPADASSPPKRPTRLTATVCENEEKNGVEIRFPEKPPALVRAKLKAAGWRWHGRSQCWYTRRSPRSLAFAEELIGASRVAKPIPAAAPGPPAPLSVLNIQIPVEALPAIEESVSFAYEG